MAIIKSERFAGKPHLVGEFPIVFDESGLAEVPAAVACLVSGMKFFVVLDKAEIPTTESIQSEAVPVVTKAEPVATEEVEATWMTEKPEYKKSKRR